MPGGRIDIEVAPDLRQFPAQLESGMRGAMVVATKIGGVLGAALGLKAGAQAVLDLGNSFTNELNSLQAVSNATAEQMQKVRDAAMGLGNDASIADASAADAAAAMTELAKGGFSVEQSMAAARGTLELAAAAQIDAATAATIQSQALQAFGLDADYAAKAADVLANGANASSAEITDIAYGLQQAGTVAHGFGISMEDTVTTLAMFANAGITGSDAGTLMKSSLLALTDQGKPAQQAIEELGLTVYDQNKQFVGMRSLFDQLADASTNMSQEQFQAATNTLFGSDAIRQAMVAAQQGAPGFDRVAEAINRQGTAAKVAAANTQGLPGALSAVQNSAEGLALVLYDAVDGPLESVGRKAADMISNVTPALESGMQSLGESIGSAFSEVASSDFGQDRLGELETLIGSVQSTAIAAAPAIGEIAVSVAKVGAMVTGGGLTVLLDILNGSAAVAGDVLVPALNLVASAIEGNEAAIATAAGGFLAFEGISSLVESVAGPFDEIREKADSAREFVGHFASATTSTAQTARYGTIEMGRFGTAIQQIGTRVPAIANMQTAFLNAATGADRFGRAVGTAAAAGVGIRTAAAGVTSALGGPFGVAIAGAGLALAAYGQHQASIAERNRQIAESAKEVGEALAASNGALTEAARTAAAAALENNNLAGTGRSLLEYLESIGVSGQRAAAGLAGSRAEMEATLAVLDEQAELERQINSERLSGEGFGSTALGQLFNVGGAKDAANEAQNAAAAYRDLYDATLDAEEAERRRREASGELDTSGTTTELGTMADTMREFADSTGTAASKVDILNGGLAALRGDAMSMENATQEMNDALRGFGEAITNAGGAAVDSAGRIDTTTAAGSRLLDSVKRVQDGYDGVVSAAYQAELQQTGSAEAAAVAAVEAGNTQREQFIATAIEAGATRTVAEGLANTYGLFPDQLLTMVRLNGTEEAAAALEALVQKERIARIKVAVDNFGVSSVEAWAAATNGRVGRENGGQLPGRASGGRMPGTGPGTERTDGIYAVTPEGLPIAMVDGREWVVNSEMSDKYDRELAMINAGTFPKLPGFETGGRIAVNRATSYLSGEDGKEYQYGGVGSPSWDCSGYVSAGYAMLTGRDPNTRWFTTESDFNALGFEDGPGPRSALNIGVMRGGGGMYSHMAATLDGIPFESGGAGVVFGHSTLGADDPNLPLKWHLPVSAFVPPGDESSAGGGYERRRPRNRETWDEQDDLKLDSARIAVQQAIESRDKAMNDPKKSQADKDQAENKVQQAEAKVRELEEKKRAAESGASISPEAPELLTNLTDEELRLRSLERAVDEARWDRNDVYADPESTQFERDEADDKLQRAINALREEQVEQRDELAPAAPALRGRMTDDQIRLVELEQAVKEAEKERNAVYADPRSTDDERLAADLDLQKALNARDEGRKGGGSGSGSGVKSLGAVGLELAEVFAGGVLETFGLEDSPIGFVPKLLFGSGDIGGPLLQGIGTTGIPAMIAQQQVGPAVVPTFSDAEIATQGPVVPGSPGWLEELVNSLRIPAVLRDAGGPLPHGMAGLNLSGETEWVQTAEDKRRYDRDMRELAALRASASGVSGAALEQLGQRQESLLKSLGQLATRRGHTINAYGMDPDKVGRQIEQVLRRDALAQMSMGGLPG